MISTNQSDISLNNQLNQSECRLIRHRKGSNKSICRQRSQSLSSLDMSSMSSYNEQTIERRGNEYKQKCFNSRQTSIVRTHNYGKVKNSAKNDDNRTCLWSTRLSYYLNSMNSWTKYRPMCYLIELIGRCRRPWIKSTKATGDAKIISTSLPNEAITRNNSRTQESYKSFNRSSYFSSLSLNSIFNMYSPLLALVLLISFVFRIAEACSSRSTPKPRPPSPTTRPNITFQTYACPEAYAKWYCLNGATCFSVRIGESILYNCECADGYMGQRCEFKDLDGSYLPSREKVLVETASIAGGVTVAIILMVAISIFYYQYLRRRKKEKRMSNIEIDEVDRKPFSRVDSLKLGTARNILYNYREDYSRYPEHKRLQDLESGNNSVHNLLRPIIITSENNDQNHEK